jgi:homogentisate 1,2-dioxygenase
LKVSPGDIAIIPQGFRFHVNLPDGPSRGYVAEIFGTHFQLPDLGPIDIYSPMQLINLSLCSLIMPDMYN